MRMFMKVIMMTSLIIIAAGCNNKQEAEKSTKEIPVKSLKVIDSSISKEDEYIGSIVESKASSLSFEVSGNVKQVLVSEGQKVKKGQLLAILYKGNIKNNYLANASTLKQAQDAYNRISILHNNRSVPEVQFVEAKTQLEKATAAERAAKKDMDDCNLYAPYAGIIGERFIEPGTNIMSGSPAFNLVETETLKAKVSIPENEISKIKIGDNAEIQIGALNDEKVRGVVSQKGILGNSLSHAYEVRITIIKTTKDLIPGMLCNVTFFQNKKVESIVIPVNSVQLYENNERYVWVINNRRVSLRKITIGSFTKDGVMVISGLKSGERIVTEGFQKISEGSLVVEN